MHIKNSKLAGDDGTFVPFTSTSSIGGKFDGNRPRFLVIHYTAGGTASGAVNWFAGPNKVSAHLVIGHDGEITQMVPFDTVCWHAGKSRWRNVKGLNSHSIGIEVANWGKLLRSGSGGWVSSTGKPVPAERVVVAAHRDFPGTEHGWELFDEVQYEATVLAAKAIVTEYGIDPDDVVGHEDIAPIRKIDPGPAFNMDRFRALVFGRDEDGWDDLLYKVRSDNGLNLREGKSIAATVIKNLADNAIVHVIDKSDVWWLVAEVVDGKDDRTGFVHSHWLQPA